MPAHQEYQQQIEQSDENFGEQTDLEQLDEKNLGGIEEILKIAEQVEEKEQQREDEEKTTTLAASQ